MPNSTVQAALANRANELSALAHTPPAGVAAYWLTRGVPKDFKPAVRALHARLAALSTAVTQDDLTDIIEVLDQCLTASCPIPRGYHEAATLTARVVKRISKSVEEGSLAPSTVLPTGTLVSFDAPILDKSFLFADPGNPTRNLMYLDLSGSGIGSLNDVLSQAPEALLLVALRSTAPSAPIGSPYMAIVGAAVPSSPQQVAAVARLYKVARGERFHVTNHYARRQDPVTASNLDIQVDYTQFEDVAHVLSEANEKDDVLDRFLRLYQVLENFMVRRTVVNVTRSASGRPFSIRDFRRLYKEVIDREQDSLTDLFVEAFSLAVPPTALGGPHANLQNYIRHLLQTGLPPVSGHAIVETILDRICPNAGFTPMATFHQRVNGNVFSRVIYTLRNSIVHNKETEFHLTHKTLPPELLVLINNVVIPAVEETIFACLCAPSNLVRYGQRHIFLY